MPPADEKLFQAAIVTPEALVAETKVSAVQFPAHDGMVGILNHRAPLLTKLGTGVLRLEGPSGAQQYVISGGYAQMKDNVLTILTDEATPAAAVTASAVAAENAKANDAALPAARRETARARAAAMGQLLAK